MFDVDRITKQLQLAQATLGSPINQTPSSSGSTNTAFDLLCITHDLGITKWRPKHSMSRHSADGHGSTASAVSSDSDESDGGNLLTSVMSSAKRLGGLLKTAAEDLYIELTEPYRVYQPGDVVKGQVIVRLAKPTSTMHMSLRLTGQVLTGHGKQRVRSTLFSEHLTLYGTHLDKDLNQDEGESVSTQYRRRNWQMQVMEPGRHVFDFACRLPNKSLPSSVDFGKGSITYAIRCEHQKPRSLLTRGKSTCRKNLQVQDCIDIALIPRPRPCILDPDAKSKRREDSGRVRASIELARAGYLAGQSVALTIQLQHIKPIKNMRGAIATLYRLSRFDLADSAPQSFRKDLAQSISPLLVDPVSLRYKVSPRLKIPPDTFPSIKAAGPVSFRYFVEVVLDLTSRTKIWQSSTSSAVDSIGFSGTGQHYFSVETGGQAMDTEALKREKDAHCVVFEVTIGTRDSAASNLSRLQQDRPASMIDRHSPTSPNVGPGMPFAPGRQRSHTATTEQQLPRTMRMAEFATDDKAAMQRREEALLPSEPPPLAYGESEDFSGQSSGSRDISRGGQLGRPQMLSTETSALVAPITRSDASAYALRPSSPGNILASSTSIHGSYSPLQATRTISRGSLTQMHARDNVEDMVEQDLPSYLQARQREASS